MAVKDGKFVPRQRKRKALDRSRAKGHAEATDSNAVEIENKPTEDEQKKEQLRKELQPEGVKVTSKKAKRLEKYIENKLRKDESRELLAKLAETKLDTSLFSSAKAIGQTKESKREALRRAIREEKAGVPDEAREELLYSTRKVQNPMRVVREREDAVDDASASADEGEGEDEDAVERGAEVKTSVAAPAVTAQPVTAPKAIGSGLKRPLDTDESGRPVLAKRQKRGGVKSKAVPSGAASLEAAFLEAVPDEEVSDDSDADEWNGFSSEEDPEAKGEGSEEDSSEEDEESDSDESMDDEDDDEDEAESRRKERSSAFKAWAHQQRNEALGYKPVESESGLLNIPKPANFQPRPIEQDPLPQELQPTTNTERKAYSVTVTRDAAIQAARLELPVVGEEQKIMEAIHNNDIVVICGATGSGKTTQVPQFLFEAGYGSPDSPTPGMIGVTQPRRVAAVSMSKRVGQELGDRSDTVAYQIRFEGTVGSKTAIKFMTDGVLLREVAQDFALRKYSAIIIDEAHERSVNTDILIGMLSRVVKVRAEIAREDQSLKPLKLIIMSATLRIEDLTLNPNLFSNPPPVIEVEGRQHPVTNHFARKTHHDYVEDAFRKISRGHRKLPPGAILVFLTGQNEIMQLQKRLKAAFGGMQSANTPKVRIPASDAAVEVEDIEFGDVDDRMVNDLDDEELSDEEDDDADEFDIEDEESGTGPSRMHVLPLYSLLPTKDQLKVFDPPPEGSRQVILATNVAETSLTIPGVRYVFDAGRSKERRYDRHSGVQSFEIGWISKASANQRSGRAGRTGPGHCWRLYSSAIYERDFPEFADPELLRMPIEGVVLQLKSMNIDKVVNFPFPSPPDQRSLIKAEKVLQYLSAISPEGRVTKTGGSMSLFPLSPRFARILLLGHQQDCIHYAVALVAGLSAGEVFIPETTAIPPIQSNDEDSEDFRTTEDVIAEEKQTKLRRAFNAVHKNFCSLDDRSDAIKMLQVVGEFAHEPTEAWCESHFVRLKVLREIQQLRRQLVDLLRTNMPAFSNLTFVDQLPRPSTAQVQALKQMVAVGFIDQVAIRADAAPVPPKILAAESWRKPKRAIDVPYVPLLPLEGVEQHPEDACVFIHPGSPLSHLSVDECPQYVIYAHLQKAGNIIEDEKRRRPKTRMHAMTDVTGAQLANLAKDTPLVSYGKPIKEVKGSSTEKAREVWVVPYLRAEIGGGMGWPLPAKRVKQKKVPSKGWIVESKS